MLDLKFIRENPEIVRQAMVNRQEKSSPLEEILRLDTERRQKMTELEDLRRNRKQASKERQADAAEEGRALRTKIHDIEETMKILDVKLNDLLLQMPNIPGPLVPVGKDSTENVIVRTWGEPKKLPFPPKPHWELGESLGIIDFERGVKLSGTRFYILRGLGARLQRAVIAYMLDLHTLEHGYKEIYPPYMVKKEMLVGSGQLPKFIDNLYHDAEEDYWWVPTAEVPLTNLHRDEIIPPGMLPFYYVAYTACFRREKMSAGKDTRGIKRGHQFDKVEMYKFVEPDKSCDELDKMVHDAEEVCEKLGLAYRIVQICTGDIGFGSTMTYDIEVWAPGCQEWLEVSSCSNCGDFQGRRANVRFRPAADAKPQFVHTLNGSGLALPRIMIAIMENYQQEDGSIAVPKVLQDFLHTDVIRKD
ncbi:MAG TPA: serine--tRNA ligase [Dehalococcoidales bacterium]|jgi:seryl-tRNA synthetase|nr:serine--tRNA ligase [Dehalococcoidales bacterium]